MGSSTPPDLTSRVLRHERLIVAAGIAVLAGLSWAFLLAGAGMPTGMDGMNMAAPPFAALLVMWWLMMVAMMLPSAAPAILLYARVRQMRGGEDAVARSWVFLAGYIAVWCCFAVAAAALQTTLSGSAMAFGDPRLSAGVLIAAGVYQLSPLKGTCLRQCRSPVQFISRHWRPGAAGAVRLGLLHGAYCVGCCWLLMALLFVGGVMNFLWIAALTLIVGMEKLLPRGEWIGRAAGIVLIGSGAAVLAR